MRKILAALTALTLGGLAMAPAPTTPEQTQSQTQPGAKEQATAPSETVKVVRQYRRSSVSGRGWGAPGIPPQVYGERYVRRGTHKKSNKN